MKVNKAIGGYFELELIKGTEFHPEALSLNTGRNAFEYILRAKRYKTIYLPFYTCEVMLEPLEKLGIDYEFYKLDSDFFPIFDFERINAESALIYTNYFGVFTDNITKLKGIKNLIIDSSQSFFSKPFKEVDTFYSARKFFGVPDGAYLYTDTYLDRRFEEDVSVDRFDHLVGRIDVDAETFYSEYQKANAMLKNQPIKKMSKITRHLLQSINYGEVEKIRNRNFNYFHERFNGINKLDLNAGAGDAPMVYPLLVDNGEKIKNILISNKIYIATYWPNVIHWVDEKSFEYELVNNLVCLPIDQRVNIEELQVIVDLVLSV